MFIVQSFLTLYVLGLGLGPASAKKSMLTQLDLNLKKCQPYSHIFKQKNEHFLDFFLSSKGEMGGAATLNLMTLRLMTISLIHLV